MECCRPARRLAVGVPLTCAATEQVVYHRAAMCAVYHTLCVLCGAVMLDTQQGPLMVEHCLAPVGGLHTMRCGLDASCICLHAVVAGVLVGVRW
jgi:hypothetical protein